MCYVCALDDDVMCDLRLVMISEEGLVKLVAPYSHCFRSFSPPCACVCVCMCVCEVLKLLNAFSLFLKAYFMLLCCLF